MTDTPVLFHYFELVGRWRLRLSPDFRAFVEARIQQQRLAEAAAEAALAAAWHEACGAEFELSADGTFISRSHGCELLRAAVAFDAGPMSALEFEKAPGATVRMLRSAPDVLLVQQPGTPDLCFDRVVLARLEP